MFEKKIVPLRLPRDLNVSESMGKEIKDLADRECRKVQEQLRYLLRLGLEEVRRRERNNSQRGGR